MIFNRFGWIFVFAVVFTGAKLSDQVLRLGLTGEGTEIIASEKGIIRYNGPAEKFQFSDDGSTFKDFGAGTDSSAVLYFADISDRSPGSPNLNYQDASDGSGIWIEEVERPSGLTQGFTYLHFRSGLFSKPPVCWTSSADNYIVDMTTPVDQWPNDNDNLLLRSTHMETFNAIAVDYYIWCQHG